MNAVDLSRAYVQIWASFMLGFIPSVALNALGLLTKERGCDVDTLEGDLPSDCNWIRNGRSRPADPEGDPVVL